jgi:hypothetical protein
MGSLQSRKSCLQSRLSHPVPLCTWAKGEVGNGGRVKISITICSVYRAPPSWNRKSRNSGCGLVRKPAVGPTFSLGSRRHAMHPPGAGTGNV